MEEIKEVDGREVFELKEVTPAELSELETKAAIEINYKKNSCSNTEDDFEDNNSENNERILTLKNFLKIYRSLVTIAETLVLYYEKGFIDHDLSCLSN